LSPTGKKSRQAPPKKGLQRQRARSKRPVYLYLAGAIALLLIAAWWIKASCFAQSIRFDLRNKAVAGSFVPSSPQEIEYTTAGIRLSCSEPCYLLSPLIDSTWEEHPFLKAQLEGSGAPSASIFWLADKSKEANGIREVSPTHSLATHIVSANSFRPWNRQMPWEGRIDHVGLRLNTGSVFISDIVLTDSLTPWEWIQFSIAELRPIEPFLAYSINIIWGASINGWSLTLFGGGLAVLALLIALFSSSVRISRFMAGFAVALVLIVDAPFVIGLMRTSREASPMSAWKNSVQEEEAARFGVDFAEIARIVRRDVPTGSTLYVPNRNRAGISLESEPLHFQLWPHYIPARSIEEADYVLLLDPSRARYDAQRGAIVIPDHTPVPANPVAIVNSRTMILKRTYDK